MGMTSGMCSHIDMCARICACTHVQTRTHKHSRCHISRPRLKTSGSAQALAPVRPREALFSVLRPQPGKPGLTLSLECTLVLLLLTRTCPALLCAGPVQESRHAHPTPEGQVNSFPPAPRSLLSTGAAAGTSNAEQSIPTLEQYFLQEWEEKLPGKQSSRPRQCEAYPPETT